MKFISMFMVSFLFGMFSIGGAAGAIDHDLYDSSDVVAIVNLIEGKIKREDTYFVSGQVEMLVKGIVPPGAVSFSHVSRPFSDNPSELGGSYLVFLIKGPNGLETVVEGYSVISVGSILASREDLLNAFKRLGIDPKWGVLDPAGEFVWYPEICDIASDALCSKLHNVMKHSIHHQ